MKVKIFHFVDNARFDSEKDFVIFRFGSNFVMPTESDILIPLIRFKKGKGAFYS